MKDKTKKDVQKKNKRSKNEKSKDGRLDVLAPVVARLYNEKKALVDAFNARKASRDIQPRSRRKYNAPVWAQIIRLGVNNPLILFIESPHLASTKPSNYSLQEARHVDVGIQRANLYSAWIAECLKWNGRNKRHVIAKFKLEYPQDTTVVHALALIPLKTKPKRRQKPRTMRLNCVQCLLKEKKEYTKSAYHCVGCRIYGDYKSFCTKDNGECFYKHKWHRHLDPRTHKLFF